MIKKEFLFSFLLSTFISLIIVGGVSYISIKNAVESNKRFHRLNIENTYSEIANFLNTLESDILGLRTFFHSSLTVGPDQFRLFAQSLLNKDKSLSETFYIPIVQTEKKQDYINYVRQMGYPTYFIYEYDQEGNKVQSIKSTLYPIRFVEPMTPLNSSYLGLNVSSIPYLEAEINETIKTGLPTSAQSGQIFKNEILLITGIYAGKQETPNNAQERIQSVNGILIFKINLNSFKSKIASNSDIDIFQIKLIEPIENYSNQNSFILDMDYAEKRIGFYDFERKFDFGNKSFIVSSRINLDLRYFFSWEILLPIIGSLIFSILIIIFTYREFKKGLFITEQVKIKTIELLNKNAQLDKLNSSVTAMLESLGPGLLFFDQQGMCSSTFSEFCKILLEKKPAGKSIFEVLELNKSEQDQFERIIHLSFNNTSALAFEDMFKMAPLEYNHGLGKKIQLDYRPIYNSDNDLVNILVIATDRTDEELNKNLLKEKEQFSEKIIRLVKSKKDYAKVLEELYAYFIEPKNTGYLQEKYFSNLKQNIHTLKGLSGSFSIYEIQNYLHELESNLEANATTLGEAQSIINSDKEFLKKAFDEEIAFSQNILGYNILEKGVMASFSPKYLYEFHKLLIDSKETKIAKLFHATE